MRILILNLVKGLLGWGIAFNCAAGECPPRQSWLGEANGSGFGAAVATLVADGAHPVILIGAPAHDGEAGENSGRLIAVTLTDEVLWHREGPSSWSLLGRSVATVGDVDGDGRDDVVVGGPWDPGIAQQIGRVELVSGADGSLIWHWEGQEPEEHFGWAVANGGDVDGDGHPDVIVGAPSNGPIHDRPGEVTVRSGRTGGLLWLWTGEADRDRFGWSVACAGDVDEDGHADVAVGAPFADGLAGVNVGKTYVWSGRTGELLWVNEGETAHSQYGNAVASVRPIDGDDPPRLVIGALNYPGVPGQNGKVYVCSGHDGQTIWTADGEFGVQLGTAVASVGDVNGDGRADIAVSAGNAALFHGEVQLRDAADGTVWQTWVGESALDNFGDALATVGDSDGDGFDEMIVGSSSYKAKAGFRPGKVSLYARAVDADVTCDGVVDQHDLMAVLEAWGRVLPTRADVDDDGVVGFHDLLLVLTSWTQVP